jgi:hypothetical protein
LKEVETEELSRSLSETISGMKLIKDEISRVRCRKMGSKKQGALRVQKNASGSKPRDSFRLQYSWV